MSTSGKISRRIFAGRSLMAAAAARLSPGSGAGHAPAASELIGVGIIGVGSKGTDHMNEILSIEGTEIRGICDIYTVRLDRAVNRVRQKNPGVRSYVDYRRMLESKDIDAIVIATPDHWHSQMTIDAAEAQKDIYVEKGMTRTVAEAKAMVDAVKRNKRILQLGHQRTSSPVTWKARELCESGQIGHVSLIRLSRFRNSIQGEWNYRIDPQAGPETIDWKRFLGSAPPRTFDPERFFRWRRYWDYGTGISGDLLSHEWSAANVFMKLGIPRTCVASGGVYFWEDGREVPDVLNVLYEYPERDLSLTFSSTFSNSRGGTESETIVFGSNGTLVLAGDLTMHLEPSGEKNLALIESARQMRREAGQKVGDKDPVPVLTFTRKDGRMPSHMQNFFDCVRSRERTRCNEDDGFDEAVTLVMSVVSYREKRMVTWDPQKKDIV